MKTLKVFIKLLEAPQRSVKIKIEVIASLRPRSERKGLKDMIPIFQMSGLEN